MLDIKFDNVDMQHATMCINGDVYEFFVAMDIHKYIHGLVWQIENLEELNIKQGHWIDEDEGFTDDECLLHVQSDKNTLSVRNGDKTATYKADKYDYAIAFIEAVLEARKLFEKDLDNACVGFKKDHDADFGEDEKILEQIKKAR